MKLLETTVRIQCTASTNEAFKILCSVSRTENLLIKASITSKDLVIIVFIKFYFKKTEGKLLMYYSCSQGNLAFEQCIRCNTKAFPLGIVMEFLLLRIV